VGKLTGKIARVTGGNSGLGLASATLFADQGANFILTGRRQKDLDAAVKSIGPSAIGVQADVSVLADLDRSYGIIKEKFGELDILFANAGFGEVTAFAHVSEDALDRQFGTFTGE
jgi:NAD(P)-dependent dehydrogenase (short-subunit alcohol dehydrogenase family)